VQKAHPCVNPRHLSHFVWRSVGVWPPGVLLKKSESHRDFHRKDMLPLTQGLNYRSACDVVMLWWYHDYLDRSSVFVCCWNAESDVRSPADGVWDNNLQCESLVLICANNIHSGDFVLAVCIFWPWIGSLILLQWLLLFLLLLLLMFGFTRAIQGSVKFPLETFGNCWRIIIFTDAIPGTYPTVVNHWRQLLIHRVRKKKSLEYFRHNFIKYWPIFEILSLLQSA